METFQSLYSRLLKAAAENRTKDELEAIKSEPYDAHHLDCLLNPEKQAVVVRLADCDCDEKQKDSCMAKCFFNALYKDENGNISVNGDLCVGCSDCIESCHAKKLTAGKDILPTLEAVHNANVPVYAMIAPAFVNQYKNVTPGQLRAAFKQIGFAGMIEVALFADILTLKEALEFDRNIQNEKDFQLTSCCCPMWIAMIRRVYKELVPHVPASVSPMAACGRAIKALYPDSLTVFIGPCLAKKSEAREPDIAASTDFVLTFQEVRDIFDFFRINPEQLEDDERDHSSRAGRMYATTGGVSEAVQSTVERLNPHRKITVNAKQADGVPACKTMLNDILGGNISANFLEGMGCVGGCVGGPRILVPKEEGRKNVFEYAESAPSGTPIDNPYVIELLHRLGFDTVESLLENSDIFTREF